MSHKDSPATQGDYLVIDRGIDASLDFLLDRAAVSGNGSELCLYQRGNKFPIRFTGRGELEIVAKLIPAVMTWNNRPPGEFAGLPLNDTRA